MKMNEAHLVPLAEQSITLLREIHDISGDSPSGFIFPSQQSPKKMMSENTFLKVIDILGYKGITTGHGFRTTASTVLNESGFRPDVIERQLSHAERNQIRAAYNHAEYLPERQAMMQWWADYIAEAIKNHG
jgi:integrase